MRSRWRGTLLTWFLGTVRIFSATAPPARAEERAGALPAPEISYIVEGTDLGGTLTVFGENFGGMPAVWMWLARGAEGNYFAHEADLPKLKDQ
ncbi:MAG TPA: hypothetical protein VD902_10745 [Symbiobacteriaceae bacterium]|nr:hypothetical protein [Symbiobacteriaceae bacterium]